MMQAVGAEIVRELYQAFLKDDFEAVRSCLADDVEWMLLGRSPLGGTHRGREAVVAFLRRLKELSAATLRPWRPDSWDIAASPHHLVLMDRWLATHNGRSLDSHQAIVIAVERGRVAACYHYVHDLYSFDEFWS